MGFILQPMIPALTPDLLLKAYSMGVFPMAPSSNSPYIDWVCPKMRGLLPIAGLHIPRRLKKTLRAAPYEMRINTAFEDVMRACADTNPKRPDSWINEPIINAFCGLHERGFAHSVECWKDGALVGGLYGLALGSIFCGESMFSAARDASKIALVHLAARLWAGGFTILDTQFTNPHLEQFGAYEIPQEEYVQKMASALLDRADFRQEGKSEQALLDSYRRFR